MSMIPQFGFAELFLLAAVALMVVGPRDLPRLMKGVGGFVSQARGLAREFQSSFDQMAREAEIDEFRRELDELRKADPTRAARDAIDESLRPVANDIDEALSNSPPGRVSPPANDAGEPDTGEPDTGEPDGAPSEASPERPEDMSTDDGPGTAPEPPARP
ncbi:MAG: Sec-independent protein translocase protein TatB [Pseudomonadota bacterium]